MNVINVPRFFAEEFSMRTHERFISDYDLDNTCWISIQEERKGPTSNPILDKLPNIKLCFSDLYESEKTYIIGKGYETFNPPSKKQAKQLVNFLVKNKGKNVIVNCAAGVSRSGAVAKFCEQSLGYKWDEFGKSNHDIKNHLFTMMTDYFDKKYKSQKFDIIYQEKPIKSVAEIINERYNLE